MKLRFEPLRCPIETSVHFAAVAFNRFLAISKMSSFAEESILRLGGETIVLPVPLECLGDS